MARTPSPAPTSIPAPATTSAKGPAPKPASGPASSPAKGKATNHPSASPSRLRRRGRVDVPPDGSKAGTTALPSAEAKGPAKSQRTKAARPKAKKGVRSGKPATKPSKKGRLSALDAAAEVLGGLTGKEKADGIGTADLIERMHRASLWTSPGGKTPGATLYAAMLREIGTKKAESRFKRVGPGRFVFKMSGRPSRGEAGA